MSNPKCKLVVVPEGWVVVPESLLVNLAQFMDARQFEDSWTEWDAEQRRGITKALTPLPDTPPVLRWDGNALYLFSDYVVTWVANDGDGSGWYYMPETGAGVGVYSTAEEARRAAEKALGFPDGLIVEEV